MPDDTSPHEAALIPKGNVGPFAEPLPLSPPISSEGWGKVEMAAMAMAEFPYQTNADFVAAAYALAGVILRHFPDDGGAVEEAVMHNLGRVLDRLVGVKWQVVNE